METPRDNFALALAGDALGYRFVPCHPNTKVPLVKWKSFQNEKPSLDFYKRWFKGTRNNIALVCGELLVVDCDSPDMIELVLAHCGDTPHKVRTPSGGCHLGYRARKGVAVANKVRVKGEPIDLRVRGGLEMIPNSVIDAKPYEWLGTGLNAISELPLFKVSWTRERIRQRARTAIDHVEHLPEGQGRIRFPESYCLRIKSIQGENGSRALVRVVCVLRDAGRSPQQIFDFVRGIWGPACCVPEWSDREILHCIDRHCKG
jgi:hypothetical protein